MKKFIVLLALLSIWTLFSCADSQKQKSDSLNVVATIGMIADVAQNIGGDKVQVTALMGPGIDPHQYKATARDLERLTSADLILYNGLHLEAKMGEIFEKMEDRKMTRGVAENLPEEKLLMVNETTHDPHVWFDVELWAAVSDEIAQALMAADPKNKTTFEANHAVYRQKLEALHGEVKEKIAMIPEDKRVMITAHDAFKYFGRAYGVEVRGLQGVSTVSETGTRDVQNLAEYIAKNKIPAIFVESSVPKKNIEALQAAVKSRGYEVSIGGELFSDAMGDAGTAEGTYIGMVQHNINTLVSALTK